MKTMNVLLAFSVSLLMAACQSETTETDPQSLPKDAKLTVTLQGTALSRATGTSSDFPKDIDTGEKNLNRVVVGVFFSNKTVNVIKEFTSSDITAYKTPQITCASSNNQKIVVVANVPASAGLASALSYDEFIAKTVALSETLNNVSGTPQSYQTSVNLPMSGENSDVDISAGATGLNPSVTISRLVARVSLSSVKTQFESAGRYPAAKFKITNVFLYNAASISNVHPTADFPTITEFGEGLNNSAAADYTWLNHSITGTANGGATSTENLPSSALYWFYTFANDPSTSSKSTKLVIKGEWDENGDGTKDADVYYPVIVNKIQPGTTINGSDSGNKGDGKVHRNSTYDVSVIIKGKGSDNPDTDVIPAYLQVTVTVADWALNLTQSVVFE